MGRTETWANVIVELFPLVKPNLGEPGIVVVDDAAGAAGEWVRGGFAEHVAHMWARGYFQYATAHPHLRPGT